MGRIQCSRSIPACAGEPPQVIGGLHPFRVYPRVCGGTVISQIAARTFQGLSPRVRGNRQSSVSLDDEEGSIPACAGEPRSSPRSSTSSRVYPRVCGGTPPARGRDLACTGLSPRVRGNRGRDSPLTVRERSIPACAGEPARRTPPRTSSRVYPRVCGGTALRCERSTRRTGLSPRVRGNRRPRPAEGASAGSIPACAGEPAPAEAAVSPSWVYPRVCGGTRLAMISIASV